MSFGASLSDIIVVVTFCKSLYRKCRDAGGEYDEISREVKGLHVVLRHLIYEVEAPESPLNRDRAVWGHQLAPIIGDCDSTLRQLDALIVKYGKLSSANSSPTNPRIIWDKIRFGSNEMDLLGSVRVKLISHKTSLTLFLDTIQLHQSGKMATKLDNHGGQLDKILDKVDGIAARMGQGNGSIMTNYDDDDKEVWKQFRRELVAEGFSSDVLQQHKDVLRAYIREIDQKGLLDEVSVDSNFPQTKAGGINPERWLESVQNPPSEDLPLSLRLASTASDESSLKEMVIREDNMKFPTGMKFERPKPETMGSEQQRVGTTGQRDRKTSDGSQSRSSQVPRLITSDDNEIPHLHPSDDESEAGSHRSGFANALVIRTSDLIASSQALALRPPGSPTTSYRSQGSFGEDSAMKSMSHRPRNQVEYGSSPIQSRSMPNPAVPDPASTDRGGATPRGETIKLDPDEYGNEIPSDAKWTRINRRLVSPEVLDQDRRRYEARPDFVAVLGTLTRAEVEDLAARTAALRHARHLRHHPPPQSEQAPPQPPRPIQPQNQTHSYIPMPIPVPIPISKDRKPTGRETPSTDGPSSYTSSSSESSLAPNQLPKFKKQPVKRGYQGSDIGSVSGYPNPFGQPVPPPSPMWSPAQPAFAQPQQPQALPTVRFPNSPPERSAGNNPSSGYYTHEPSRPRDRDREREREKSRDDGRPHDSRPRNKEDLRPRERDRDEPRTSERRKYSSTSTRHGSHSKPSDHRVPVAGDKKSRWKENLTAAGIGGAAVSLLNVLSEAAEGI